MTEAILCAVDESEAASRVVGTARGLAEAWGARLVVVRVAEQPDREEDDVIASIRDQLGDQQLDVLLVRGSPAAAIADAADRESAELIVVGSRGRGALRATLLGSVSRELAMRAARPVVIVPMIASEAGEDAEASVVCGVDGSDEALGAAAFAGRLAKRLNSRLVIAHARQNLRAVASYPGARSETPPASGQPDAVERLVNEVLQKAGEESRVGAVQVAEPGPPVEVLRSIAEREHARLIVIAARGIGGLTASLLGSVAAELPSVAPCPVLVLSESAIAAIA